LDAAGYRSNLWDDWLKLIIITIREETLEIGSLFCIYKEITL
jgi:hypothetical protein